MARAQPMLVQLALGTWKREDRDTDDGLRDVGILAGYVVAHVKAGHDLSNPAFVRDLRTLRSDIDMNGGKSHISTRFEYGNIKPPM